MRRLTRKPRPTPEQCATVEEMLPKILDAIARRESLGPGERIILDVDGNGVDLDRPTLDKLASLGVDELRRIGQETLVYADQLRREQGEQP